MLRNLRSMRGLRSLQSGTTTHFPEVLFRATSSRKGSEPWAKKTTQPFSTATHGNNPKAIGEELVFAGHMKIVRRSIEMPDGHVAKFDISKARGSTVFVVPWCSRTKTLWMLSEFYPGCMDWRMGCVAGFVEAEKHEGGDPEAAARMEVEEEAHLRGGKLVSLLSDEGGHKSGEVPSEPSSSSSTSSSCSGGTAATLVSGKYTEMTSRYFLCIDPEPSPSPPPRDKEELIEIHPGVSMETVC
mmetsp:Transcript_51979/g.101801  ORF Transcript_51979/g.101801 Transcript_51979/m.101801 type:complete len:242 (-) Transcript_51979:512-1237(-)